VGPWARRDRAQAFRPWAWNRSSATWMAAFAAQFRLLTLLLADLAAVFAPSSALGDHASTGGMRAFLGVGHFTPPWRWTAILLTFVAIDVYRKEQTRVTAEQALNSRAHTSRLALDARVGLTCVWRPGLQIFDLDEHDTTNR